MFRHCCAENFRSTAHSLLWNFLGGRKISNSLASQPTMTNTTLIFAQILKDNEVYNRLQKDGKEKTAACGGDVQRMTKFHDRTQEVLVLVGTLTSLLHNVNLEQHEFQIRTDKRLDETQAC